MDRNPNNPMVTSDCDARPDLKPVDPRGSNLAPNDFFMSGAIDNDSIFDVAAGQSLPRRD